MGFTATPIEKEDVSTPSDFGNYIDVTMRTGVFNMVLDAKVIPKT